MILRSFTIYVGSCRTIIVRVNAKKEKPVMLPITPLLSLVSRPQLPLPNLTSGVAGIGALRKPILVKLGKRERIFHERQ
jgi:hypothetical protein